MALLLPSLGTQTSAGTQTLTGPLSATGCYAPVANGSWGYCGPSSCKDAYITCAGDEGGGPATVDGTTGTYATLGGVTHSADTCQSFLTRCIIPANPQISFIPRTLKSLRHLFSLPQNIRC